MSEYIPGLIILITGIAGSLLFFYRVLNGLGLILRMRKYFYLGLILLGLMLIAVGVDFALRDYGPICIVKEMFYIPVGGLFVIAGWFGWRK